jgi:hypothetical protein
MTKYRTAAFAPGSKSVMRPYLSRALTRQYYRAFTASQAFQNENNGDDMTMDELCGCVQHKANKLKQGMNDPSDTEANRVSRALGARLGGRTVFGNANLPVRTYASGAWEGSPGGLRAYLRLAR